MSQKLHETNPLSEQLKYVLTTSYANIGSVYLAQGKLEEALLFFQKDMELLRELYAANPDNESFKRGLAIACFKLGDTYRSFSTFQEALHLFQEDCKLTEELQASPIFRPETPP